MASKDKASCSDHKLKQNHEYPKCAEFNSDEKYLMKDIVEDIVNNVAVITKKEQGDQDCKGLILDEQNEYERKEFEAIVECAENNEDLESNYVLVSDSPNPISSKEHFSTSEYQIPPLELESSLRFWDTTSDAIEDDQDSLATYMRENFKTTNVLSETLKIIEEAESSV